MKTLRKNGGFTLVELIVVIAILAILAGVAVPAYSGYIKKAEDAKVVTELSAVHTAAQATAAGEGKTITKVTVTGAGVITVEPAVDYTEMANLLGNGAIGDETTGVTYSALGTSMSKSDTYKSGAEWTATDGWTAE